MMTDRFFAAWPIWKNAGLRLKQRALLSQGSNRQSTSPAYAVVDLGEDGNGLDVVEVLRENAQTVVLLF